MPTLATQQLDLIWLSSPALPVGGFSYSEGLEAAVDAGWVHDEASTRIWLADQLHLGQARADLAVCALSLQALRDGQPDALAGLSQWVLHTRESAELRLQSTQMGRSLLDWLPARLPPERWALAQPTVQAVLSVGATWPVAFALAAHVLLDDIHAPAPGGAPTGAAPTVPLDKVLLSAAMGWAENATQAAVRAVPLGQSAGQRVLAHLVSQIGEAVQAALSVHSLDDAQAFCPGLALLSAQHETQYSRLFRS
jgi:urease accessory protein